MADLSRSGAHVRWPRPWVRALQLCALMLLGLGLMGSGSATAAPAREAAATITVRPGDTLYRLAGRHLQDGVSLAQMTAGLFLANPAAFAQANIDRLKAGAVLTVPRSEDMKGISDEQARRLIARHSQDQDAALDRATEETARLAGKRSLRLATGQEMASRRSDADMRVAELARNIEALKQLQAARAETPVTAGSEPPAGPAPTPAPANPIVQPPSPLLPQFPWPPPRASAEATVPENWLPAGGQATLGSVAGKLERALEAARFRRWSYLSVPNGFALVTQMEQIQADGHPSSEPARWSTSMPPINRLGFFDFVLALANALPGHYRVIVFVVTDQPRNRTEGPPTAVAAEQWLANGFDRLPSEVARVPFGSQRRVGALVYEFRKPSSSAPAQFVAESQTQGSLHLQRAGIADPLSRP